MDGHRTPRGKSVLEELRLDPGFVVKAKLAVRIQKSIAEMGLKQREAAARMGITQPKLSLIARGKLDDISQAKLEACLRALGHASRSPLVRGTMGWERLRFGTQPE